MKKLVYILFFQYLFAQSIINFDLNESFISYDGKHPAHNWTGISKEIQGTFELNKEDLTQSKVDLFVPVFSFDSKNANRDSNMLDVVEEYYYPYVRFISSKIEKVDDGFNVVGNLSFHGITKEFTIPVSLIQDDKRIVVESDFSIMLTDFKIRRPSLLTIKIRNQIDIKVFLVGSS
jgi:polyisoprenoid-binding protein YceI|tara:strand:+ start:629 stop:1156 length:528 start_codon:yes stop_codon:yes gene_type:complete